MQRAGGAEQHVDQAAAPQRRDAQWHRATPHAAALSQPPLSPERLHPLPAPCCPARAPAPPRSASLFCLMSGLSRCITSHLHISLQASDTTILKRGVSGREAPHFSGHILRDSCYFRQSQGLCYCPVQCPLLRENALIK